MNPHEPRPQGDLREPPAFVNLTEDQRKIWDYAITHAPAGLLKHLDWGTLVTFVKAADAYRNATEQVSRFGLVMRAQSGELYPSPFIGIANKQAAIMLKASSELGFTPAARPRIQLAPESDGPDDFAKLTGSA
jgi:P27 family predicted phage terminase small subunit